MFGVDGDDFRKSADIDIVIVFKSLGRLDEQTLAVGDDAADIIWQAAVSKRDVLVFFKDNNLVFFAQPASSGRSCRTTGNATDDNYFFIYFYLIKISVFGTTNILAHEIELYNHDAFLKFVETDHFF